MILVLACAGLLAGCREQGGEGEYFALGGKLFVFNYRVATATYVINLQPLRPMQDGYFAVAAFENPAGGDDILVRQKIWPKLDKVTLESTPLRCIVKDRPYRVSIRIEGPDGATLQTIQTTMASTQDQSVLPDRPLVVGPLYTPNPDKDRPADPAPPCPPPG